MNIDINIWFNKLNSSEVRCSELTLSLIGSRMKVNWFFLLSSLTVKLSASVFLLIAVSRMANCVALGVYRRKAAERTTS